MEFPKSDVYLTCVRRKGHPKKHVSVCRQCRWQKSCREYQKYSQPELPVNVERGTEIPQPAQANPPAEKQPAPAFIPLNGPSPEKNAYKLLEEIKKGLEEIRDLCD